jgi:hypothetical protein
MDASRATVIAVSCESRFAGAGAGAGTEADADTVQLPPRTASAERIAGTRAERAFVVGRGEPAAELRATLRAARPGTGRTRLADVVRPCSLAAATRSRARREEWSALVRSRVGKAESVEPISMPPPASFPSGPSPAVVADVSAGADPVVDSGGGGGSAAGLGGLADAGGAGSGSDCGAGGASGAEGGMGAPRGGRNVSGSTYVSCGPTRTPRWRYGTACSASPVGPASEITSPSETRAPRRTRSAPRCVSDTLVSSNSIVTVRPCVGTWPAKVTAPPTGARTDLAPPRATSIPRCCPAAYVSPVTENPSRSCPSAGQVHAHAGVPATSAQLRTAPTQAVHLQTVLVARRANMHRR